MLARLRNLLHAGRLDRELDAELGFHLDALEAEHVARGLSPGDARLAARRDFGSVVATREAYRERRGLPGLETIAQDVRHACRLLRRNPGFALVTALTLAVGIGATTTIFSVVDAVLLKPLPYSRADRIVRLLERRPTGVPSWFSTPVYLEWTASSTAFEHIAAYQLGLATVSGTGEPIPLRVGRVTAHYFDVFGVRAYLGRTFVEGEDVPGRHQVVVLSHATWMKVFGGDPTVVGRTITLDDNPYVVIGVLSPDSAFDRSTAQIWYPLAFRPSNMS